MVPESLRGTANSGDVWLADAYARTENEIVLEFAQAGAGRLTLHVHYRPAGAPRFLRTAHFDLVHHPDRGDGWLDAKHPFTHALRKVGEALAQVDTPDCEWTVEAGPPARANPLPRKEASRYLTVDAPCASRCVFCTLADDKSPGPDASDATFARYCAEVDAARAEQTQTLYLDGRDPVAYPRLPELLAKIAQARIPNVRLLTPGTLLADLPVLDALLAVLPRRHSLQIPLYGVTAQTHEAVTRAPGSFARVMQVLEELCRRKESQRVVVVTVITGQNLAEIGLIRQRMQAMGLLWRPHVVYPMASAERRLYRHSAVRLVDLAARLHALSPPLLLPEVPPCVVLRHPPRGLLRLPRHRHALMLPGEAMRDGVRPTSQSNAVVMPCPSAPTCAARHLCPQMLYSEYVDHFGIEEFRPVTPAQLPLFDRVRHQLRKSLGR